MIWESVSVAPVRTPDGHVTVPKEVLESMERNKIGLKGENSGVCRADCQTGMCKAIVRWNVLTEGPLETQVGKGAVSLNLTLRRLAFHFLYFLLHSFTYTTLIVL